MFVCCECCVLSGRVLCDELITHPKESYWRWCIVVCDLETSVMRRPWLALGCSAIGRKIKTCMLFILTILFVYVLSCVETFHIQLSYNKYWISWSMYIYICMYACIYIREITSTCMSHLQDNIMNFDKRWFDKDIKTQRYLMKRISPFLKLNQGF
jgi:hypothetical protein